MSQDNSGGKFQVILSHQEIALRSNIDRAIQNTKNAVYEYYKFKKAAPLYIVGEGPVPTLPGSLLEDAKLLPDRVDILKRLPKKGRGLEIGTQTGGFAKLMIKWTNPKTLDLVDLDYTPFDVDWFAGHVESGRVSLHKGLSWEIVEKFEDASYDWVYIDAGHDYESVVRDIRAACTKVRPGGYLIFNDFTNWSPLEMCSYGVMQAVCEFLCREKGEFTVSWFALHPYGYHDIALRRREAN